MSYFDLGASFGLGDGVFDQALVTPAPDLGNVGLTNPLGSGLAQDLLIGRADIVSRWRDEAAAQVTRPPMETGWSEQSGISRADFDHELKRLASEHPLLECSLTIYGIGTVFLKLVFDKGVSDDYVTGLLKCFEFAAYTPKVSESIHQEAYGHASRAVGRRQRGLVALSRRVAPKIHRDESGYAESNLFHSFTPLLLCIDDGDAEKVARFAAAWQLSDTDIVEFEYHGKLHFGWASCIVEPRYRAADAPPQYNDAPSEQIERILVCMQVAHVFLGVCEAFTQLFQDEIQQQVGGYINGAAAGRDPGELNRLRTLALAVVNLTQFDAVTQTAEDRRYFAKFADEGGIERHHRLIQEACEMLHNVQVAERQHQDAGRQNLLNAIVLLLTSLTVVSVTVDAYNFIRQDQPLISHLLTRAELLTEIILGLILLFTLILFFTRPRRTRTRQSVKRRR